MSLLKHGIQAVLRERYRLHKKNIELNLKLGNAFDKIAQLAQENKELREKLQCQVKDQDADAKTPTK
jgi:hypothetical protein